MREPCPSLETFLNLETDPVAREKAALHAAGCPKCFSFIGLVEDGLQTSYQANGRSRRIRLAWIASAAAAVLLVIGGIHWNRSGRPTMAPPSFTLPAGRPIGLQPGEHAAPADADVVFALPEGSRLRLEAGSRIRTLPLRSGDRVRLEILSGALEAEVAPGAGAFRIGSQVGEVEVLGTHFWMKPFVLRPDLPCLCVEVYSGKVSLKGETGDLAIGAGQRGILAGSIVLERQELGGTPQSLFPLFMRLLRSGPEGLAIPPDQENAARLLAALFFGGRWDTPLDLQAAPGDTEQVMQAKRILREMRP